MTSEDSCIIGTDLMVYHDDDDDENFTHELREIIGRAACCAWVETVFLLGKRLLC
jgi:hypothetical protein